MILAARGFAVGDQLSGLYCGDVIARGIVARYRQLGNLCRRLSLRRPWPPLVRIAPQDLPHPAPTMLCVDYFAAVGNVGNLSMSRASCWMISVALKVAMIPFSRSIEASVCERSELNHGTPLLS